MITAGLENEVIWSFITVYPLSVIQLRCDEMEIGSKKQYLITTFTIALSEDS